MVGEYLGEIPHTLALRRCLVTQPRPLPEVIAGDGGPRVFGLTQDIHPYIVRNIFSRLERTAYPTSPRWGARNKATRQTCGKLDYKRPVQSLPKDPRYLSSLKAAHKMDFGKEESPETQEAPKSLMRMSQASLLELSHCSLFAQRYLPPAPRLCTPVAAAPSGSYSLVCSPNTIYYWLVPKVIQLRSQRSSHIAHKAVRNFFYGIVCHVFFSPVCKGNNRLQ